MGDDGACELKENVLCEFFGNLELHMFEKMKPEELSAHIQYLPTDESQLLAFLEIQNAKVIE